MHLNGHESREPIKLAGNIGQHHGGAVATFAILRYRVPARRGRTASDRATDDVLEDEPCLTRGCADPPRLRTNDLVVTSRRHYLFLTCVCLSPACPRKVRVGGATSDILERSCRVETRDITPAE